MILGLTDHNIPCKSGPLRAEQGGRDAVSIPTLTVSERAESFPTHPP